MHARMDNVKTVYPPQTKFAGGIQTDGQHENSIPTTNKVWGGYNKDFFLFEKKIEQKMKRFCGKKQQPFHYYMSPFFFLSIQA